ncbi:carbohydrate ABC transporter permease [Cellulomonas hominis]
MRAETLPPEVVVARQPAVARRRRRVDRGKLLVDALLLVGAAATSLPFFWMVFSAVKPRSEATAVPPHLLPQEPTWEYVRYLFTTLDFGRYLVNTVVVVLIGFVGLFFMAMAGYGFAKFRFRGRTAMFMVVLATMMIPVQVTMIPTYLILNSVGLTNTLVGIALPTLVSAFGIFLFREFMSTIPDEVLEAARIDGAGEARAFLSIVLPMSGPILAVQTVLTFIAGWNSFLWPLVIAGEQSKYTLSVGLALLNQQVATNPSLQMAGAAVMVVPIVVLFVFFQRYIVQGFTMSGLK